jgi:hypothetical protein
MATKLLNTFFVSIGVFMLITFLNFSNNPPNGHTGAPLEGSGNEPSCTACHNPPSNQSFEGNISISGFPASINAGNTYPIAVTLTYTAGAPDRAGFQLVVLNSSNQNAGTITTTGPNTDLESSGGRSYAEHRPAKDFTGNTATFTFDWQAPDFPDNEVITMYAAGNIANGSGSSNDLIVTTTASGILNVIASDLEVSITSSTNLLCFLDNDGTASAIASGGTGNYTYEWSNGQTGTTSTGLPAGTASITVTDNVTNATATNSVVITQPSQLIVTVLVNSDVNCFNDFGSATPVITGGTPGYTYLWSNGETTQTATNLTAGNHFLTITDMNGCTAVDPFNVFSDTTPPIADGGGNISMDCNNPGPEFTLNGLNSSQGPNISYLWVTADGNILSGVNTSTPVINEVGTYTLIVIDNVNGCSASDNVVVFEDFEEPVAQAGNSGIICEGACFTLSASATQGTSPYSYEWSNGIGSAASVEVCPSTTTIYVVTVTGANGCSDTDIATVTVNMNPTVEVISNDCSFDLLSYTVSINTNANQITSTEGTVVNDGGGFYTIHNVPIDTVLITITATNFATGCTTEITATSPECACPDIETPTNNGDITICEGDAIPGLSVTPPTGMVVDWYNSPVGGSLLASNTDTYTPAGAGTYFAESRNPLTDCISEDRTPVLLTINDAPTVNITLDAEFCENDCGVLTAEGFGLATYSWSSGQTSQSIIVCVEEVYTVTVTNSNGCTSSASYTVTTNPLPEADAGDDQIINCYTAEVEIGGPGSSIGTDIIYSWSNGVNTFTQTVNQAGPYILTVFNNATGCIARDTVEVLEDFVSPIAEGGEDQIITCDTGLALLEGTSSYPNSDFSWSSMGMTFPGDMIFVDTPGEYVLTVVNLDNGCSGTDTVLVFGAEDPDISLLELNNVKCNGEANGSITVIGSGGQEPYSYLWSNTETTPTISNLSAGNYIVTVTGIHGCTSATMYTITEPTLLIGLLSATNASSGGADDGTASVSAIGGTPPYNYLWSNDSTDSTISGLTPGSYTLTLTDANNCIFVNSISVEINCPDLSATTDGVLSICPGSMSGSLEILEITGGEIPYSIEWSTGAIVDSIGGLEGGMYSCTITDADNCQLMLNFEIVEEDLEGPVLVTQNITIFLDEMGIASFSPSDIDGGSTDNCGIDSFYVDINTFDCSNIGDNLIQVVVFDTGTLCDTGTVIVTVEDIEAPIITLCPEDIFIENCTEVEYDLPHVTDNCGFFNVQLVEGFFPGDAFPIGITYVEYMASDASGNSSSCSFYVTVESTLMVSIQTSELDCQLPVTATLIPTGGLAPYHYLWSTGATTPEIELISSADLSWTVTDSEGCSLAGDVSIVVSPSITIDLVTTSESGMDMDGTIDASVTGGTPPYTYIWADSTGTVIGSSEDINNLAAGFYCLVVVDANGCEMISCITVDQITGTIDQELNNQITIAPNPVSDRFTVTFDLDQNLSGALAIYDRNGQKVMEGLKMATEDKLNFDASAFANGIYLLKIVIEDKVVVKKIVVNR